ncbi:hypothetical protein I3842_02G174200 [Carya illinoinensis]|uniref:PWWP domain-containing protein n=1 Tax=Carya illinoinensis TaxID=32201 RepID=A0A922K0V8_CARIL|nr:hypothetical protein I3842_02G174200 [Carya illinoinensis]KAG6728466.1 hypothetical protein I3842_02G174200 [Carya illinoinensis]KAG6728467.1 hypothetical protein I3842_02G174200 [Carya illinoinensis]KAG6728468.1 hypothetical protein I3842_02G174200 [Carya illinoinensis]
MDEEKDKDVYVGSVTEPATVVVSEHVAGETQVEGPLSEGVQRVEDGGACNGDDVMVEVLGSDVYVDGVCTHGEAGRSGAVENEIGAVGDGNSLEEDVNSLGGGAALSEAGLRGIGGSSVDASKCGTEAGVEGSLGIVESRGEQTQAVVVESEVLVREEKIEGGAVMGERVREIVASDSGTYDMTPRYVTVLDGAAQNTEVGTVDGGSLSVLGSTCGETQVAQVQEVVMVAREAGLKKKGVEVSADGGRQLMDDMVDAIEDGNSEEVSAFDEKATTSRNENGVGDSSVLVGSVGVESQVVGEDALLENVEHSERGLVVEGDEFGGGLADDGLDVNDDFAQIDSNCGLQFEVEEQEMKAEQVGLKEDQGMEVEEDITETEQSKADEEKFLEQEALNAGSIGEVHQASYQLPSENEGEFSVSDLVWGKVRSHPWWPGQIFDPADSSEKAMKHHRKDCFLVAYFGDRTFAWNEASQLKAFRTHFSHIEKQSNSEALQNAVDCALEEVSRRVELGLACSCIPKDAFDRIKSQMVENTGIRQESITRDTVDRFASAISFEPDKLIKYLKALAQYPSGGSDRLEVVIAKAQLLAFCRLKGYRSLPEFQFCGESDPDTLVSGDRMHHSCKVFEHVDDELTSFEQEISKNQNSSSNKHKQDFKDDVFYRKKERSLLELMGGAMDSPDGDDLLDGKTSGGLVSPSSGKKRKTVDYHDDHGPQDGRKTIAFAKVSSKPSFKIGDCIRRVASQMTASPSILKYNSERLQKLDGGHDVPAGDEADASFQDSEDTQRGRMSVSTDYSSLDELLSQLQMAAQDPLKGYDLSDMIVSFFSDFRNSVVVGHHSRRELLAMDKVVGGKRKKSSHSVVGSPETYEFEDMSDTYWTDRVVQNGSEEQPPRRNKKREYQIVAVVQDPPQVSRRPYSRKRYSDGNNAVAADKPAGYVDENSPAEIVMNFSEVNSVPTETNLNKMFRRFGPLKESETEVDRDTSRARVVYKHSSDAEVAFSSARRFNIFGPTLVNYQINYTPSALFKASPMDTAQDHEMQLDLAALDVNLV